MGERGGFRLPEGTVNPAEVFKPALELWTNVLSVPEDGVAILNASIRDMPVDMGYPSPLRLYRDGGLVADVAARPETLEVAATNDQHAYLHFADEVDVRVGDVVVCGISHPCTAFDKWRAIYRVDADFNVTGAVSTFF